MKYKLPIQIILALGAIVLAYLVYNSVMQPVRFNNERNGRQELVIQKLKDIRDAESMYNSLNRKYTASFDTLITFIKNGQIPVIKLTARPGDTTFTNPIIDTVGVVSVMDSLFKNRPDLKPEDLKYIPFSSFEGSPKEIFTIKANTIQKGNVPVNVIEVSASNKQFLKGLDLKRNNVDPEDGLKFGSMSDPSTDGNWE